MAQHDWQDRLGDMVCTRCGALMSRGPDARTQLPCPAQLCAHCGQVIEPDDGGAIWYHADSMEMPCDPEGEQSRDRMAEPAVSPANEEG